MKRVAKDDAVRARAALSVLEASLRAAGVPIPKSKAAEPAEVWERDRVVWFRAVDLGERMSRVELRRGDTAWVSQGKRDAQGYWASVNGISHARRELKMGEQWVDLRTIYSQEEAKERGLPPPPEGEPAAGSAFGAMLDGLRTRAVRKLRVVSTDATSHEMSVTRVFSHPGTVVADGTVKRSKARLTIRTEVDAKGRPKKYARLRRGSREYRVDARRITAAGALPVSSPVEAPSAPVEAPAPVELPSAPEAPCPGGEALAPLEAAIVADALAYVDAAPWLPSSSKVRIGLLVGRKYTRAFWTRSSNPDPAALGSILYFVEQATGEVYAAKSAKKIGRPMGRVIDRCVPVASADLESAASELEGSAPLSPPSPARPKAKEAPPAPKSGVDTAGALERARAHGRAVVQLSEVYFDAQSGQGAQALEGLRAVLCGALDALRDRPVLERRAFVDETKGAYRAAVELARSVRGEGWRAGGEALLRRGTHAQIFTEELERAFKALDVPRRYALESPAQEASVANEHGSERPAVQRERAEPAPAPPPPAVARATIEEPIEQAPSSPSLDAVATVVGLPKGTELRGWAQFSNWGGKLALVNRPSHGDFDPFELTRTYTVRFAIDHRSKRRFDAVARYVGVEPHILNPRVPYEETGFTIGSHGARLEGTFAPLEHFRVRFKLRELTDAEHRELEQELLRRDYLDATGFSFGRKKWQSLLGQSFTEIQAGEASIANEADRFVTTHFGDDYSDAAANSTWRKIARQGLYASTQRGRVKFIVHGTEPKPKGASAAAPVAPVPVAPVVPAVPAPARQETAHQRERRERAERKAAHLERKAGGQWESARGETAHIPMGQPILVGHHSERRHRKALERSDAKMRKAFETSKAAEAAKWAAKGAGRAISSDDPDALEALQAQLVDLEASRELSKAINKAYRRGGWDAVAQVPGALPKAVAGAKRTLGLAPWLKAPMEVKNLGANIRRVRKRIEELEAAAERPASPPIEGEGFTIEESVEDNRIRFRFDERPDKPTITKMKRAGFRWSRRAGAWQRQLTNSGRYAAKDMAKELFGWEPPSSPAARATEPPDGERAASKTTDAEPREAPPASAALEGVAVALAPLTSGTREAQGGGQVRSGGPALASEERTPDAAALRLALVALVEAAERSPTRAARDRLRQEVSAHLKRARRHADRLAQRYGAGSGALRDARAVRDLLEQARAEIASGT